MILYICLFLLGVLVAAISQILLKIEAEKEHKSFIAEYLNVRVIVSYVLFFGATFITVLCYKFIPLSLGAMLDACGYVFVTVMGYFILKEKVSTRKLGGIILILVGVVIASGYLV